MNTHKCFSGWPVCLGLVAFLQLLLAGCGSGGNGPDLAAFNAKHKLAETSRQNFDIAMQELDSLIAARLQQPPASSDVEVLAQLDMVQSHAADFRGHAQDYRQLYAAADIDSRGASHAVSDDAALLPGFDAQLAALGEEEEQLEQLEAQLQEQGSELTSLQAVQTQLAVLNEGQALQLDAGQSSALLQAGLGDNAALLSLIAGSATGQDFEQDYSDFSQTLSDAIDALDLGHLEALQQLQQGMTNYSAEFQTTSTLLNNMHDITQSVIQNIH